MGLIVSKIRKTENSFVVTIPADEMRARGLTEGQLVGIDLAPAEIRPPARPAVQEAIDRVVEQNAAGLRYLAGR